MYLSPHFRWDGQSNGRIRLHMYPGKQVQYLVVAFQIDSVHRISVTGQF